MNRISIVVGVAVSLLSASAASAEDFYKGKQVRIVVSYAAGGGYDTIARLLQRYMPQYIAGNPTAIVVNMPGAGGLVAANHLANIAERDGVTIGVVNRFVPIMAVLGAEQAKFKADDFQWLGTTASYSDNSYLLVARADAPFRTAADLRSGKEPLIIGDTGSDVPAILKEALGFNFKIITGYKGSDEMELAFERGEINGHTSGYQSILSRRPQWLEKGVIRPLVQFGRIDRLPALKDVPTARELAEGPENRALIEFAEIPLLMARPMLAPPGVPAERVELLRAAFDKTMADPGYLADSAKQQLEMSPKNGREVQEIVRGLARAPDAVKQRYLKALGGKIPN